MDSKTQHPLAYAVRLLEILTTLAIETHLVIIKSAEMTIAYESGFAAQCAMRVLIP